VRYVLNTLYALAILIAAPWLIYCAVTKKKYRDGFRAKLLGDLPRREGKAPCVWLHAVSVGEVNLLASLLPALRTKWPDYDYVVTTTTRAGLELAAKLFPNCSLSYAPLDFSWAVKRAIRSIRPNILLLVELELWPNLIGMVSESGAKIAIVNGRLGEKSFRGYARIRRFVQPVLQRLDMVAAQNDEYARRFRQLGCDPARVHVTGSVKFDGVQNDRANPATRNLSALVGLKPEDRVFLAGSTQSPEERFALQSYLRLRGEYPKLRLILVPRHPERFDSVAAELDESGVGWLRRSQLNGRKLDDRCRVLLVDTVGELGDWWGTADIAFVGGSMGPRGGQNMIEPAAYGVAICFGPNTKNFRDVTESLLDANASVVVRNRAEMSDFVGRCLRDADYATRLGQNARQTVERQRGALGETLRLLEPTMNLPRPASSAKPHAAVPTVISAKAGI